MSMSMPLSRAVAGVLLVGLVATGGCSWFRKGDALYTQDPVNRPLEVPPPLELPRADATSASASAQPASVSAPAGGFRIEAASDVAFGQVGEALAAVPGATITSRAELLGAFDVSYEGSNFLVRVTAAGTGAQVSVVDPRGLPASGEAPVRLMAQLKAALGGN